MPPTFIEFGATDEVTGQVTGAILDSFLGPGKSVLGTIKRHKKLIDNGSPES